PTSFRPAPSRPERASDPSQIEQPSSRRAGDLFGTAAERFRVGLRARVDDRVIGGVNAARHVGWQEQQLVLDFLRVQRLDNRYFAELYRPPAVRPDLRRIRGRIIGGGNLHQEAELDRSFYEPCPETVG